MPGSMPGCDVPNLLNWSWPFTLGALSIGRTMLDNPVSA